MIDAGNNEIWGMRQERTDGELHRVGGSACDRISEELATLLYLMDAQRGVHRDGVAHGALLFVGRNDHDVADLFNFLDQCIDAWGVNSIVV